MTYDINKYYLGRLCKRKHKYEDSGQTVRLISGNKCPECRRLDHIIYTNKNKDKLIIYSSRRKKSVLKCSHCDGLFERLKMNIKKNSEHFFCSQLCATEYRKNHPVPNWATKTSKLERFIQNALIQEYPDLEFLFNDKITINNLELDIYIPSLKLAFELNGIVHYEPIYGLDRFKIVKNHDKQKLIRCYEKGIELVVIDSSEMKRFSIKGSHKYIEIIKRIIDNILLIIDFSEGKMNSQLLSDHYLC